MNLKEFLDEWHNDAKEVLVHTSGSTGKPKPLMVEKQRMLNSARITCDFLRLQLEDTALLCMSLDYIAGKMMVVRSIERHLHLITERPNGHPLSEESLREAGCKPDVDITFAAMVPMQVFNSLQVPQERERLMRIKHLIIGGGAIDEKMEQQLALFPHFVWSTYGMTETLSHIALRRLNGPEASLYYTPFESVKVSTNEEGCLVIDAPLVSKQTLVTNDIAELKTALDTPSGYTKTLFRIKGRKDNVICSGGIKIQIEEVENLLNPLLEKPFMLAKVKDEKFGEKAILLTEDTHIERIQKLCEEKLPKYWIPKAYHYIKKLPTTETGKPKRWGIENLL